MTPIRQITVFILHILLYDLTAYHRVNKISVKVEGKGIKIV
ncbi:hypothetical protein ANACAC_01092 [Anaerostipes caccae L1-92]|uniref:Uncharacterized protein n=1 Tax=Anaerostipes caccae (strain DSM 14662 / CCUG 47493 / JCM 13470 / NCIMB 13811 / L1-92) TaxID=411490 RepID=B0MBS2_ANACD|nr:hypothetical protein ANACAC_01092 [Anaerostipes caccae L1-92]